MLTWPAPSLPTIPGRGSAVHVRDSLTGSLVLASPGPVATLYVCGITPYDATHLGHAATYLAFDLMQRAWRDAGIQQVVYHRSRDAQAAGVAWGEADISAIKRLAEMGFKVTVTGGLALEDLPLFKGIPIHVFIAGRSIRDAASPVEAARQFKRSIAQLWG